MPISRGSIAIATAHSHRPTLISRAATRRPLPARSCSPGSIATATASSTREELETFFRAADSDGAGFLSRSDLEAAFPALARSMSRGDRPSKAMLIRGLFRQEIGSLQPGPKLDETAPDFTLRTNDGKSEITLSKQIGPKPVVLIFGNFTCGPFRGCNPRKLKNVE